MGVCLTLLVCIVIHRILARMYLIQTHVTHQLYRSYHLMERQELPRVREKGPVKYMAITIHVMMPIIFNP